MGMPTTYTEQELVVALKERNNQAFAFLYDNYGGALYSIIRQIITDNNELAGDVLQEVFINIWRKIESYDQTKDNVYKGAINQTTQQNVDSIGLKKVLEKLKPEHRVLVDLAYFKGFTHEEIADMMSIPLGTVKTRIRNALLQLREYLK
jgi:DNA-directed RNA polymerase specialized sigma24 family protein